LSAGYCRVIFNKYLIPSNSDSGVKAGYTIL
jgi:hypothetical protein